MKIFYGLVRRPLVVLYFSVGLLSGCFQKNDKIFTTSNPKHYLLMQEPVIIKLGEPGPEFSKRYSNLVHIQHQPAGVDFYNIDWNNAAKGTMRIDHGTHSFIINNVLGAFSGQDIGERKDEGLSEFNISAGITNSELIAHDEARIRTYAILQSLLQAGWKRFIDRSDPRLNGKAMQDYTLATMNVNGLDPGYLPNFEEWMRIESSTPWNFYANHLYMVVSFIRERTLTDPTKPGVYLLSFDIKTEAEYFRGYIAPMDRSRWKTLLPVELSRLSVVRAQKEAELRAKGIKIDETYKDPPLPDLK